MADFDYQALEEDPTLMFWICPYMRDHRVSADTLVRHIGRCGIKNKQHVQQYKQCPQETSHYAVDIDTHKKHCKSDVTKETKFDIVREKDAELMGRIYNVGTACLGNVDYIDKICTTCSMLNPQILFADTKELLRVFGAKEDTATVVRAADNPNNPQNKTANRNGKRDDTDRNLRSNRSDNKHYNINNNYNDGGNNRNNRSDTRADNRNTYSNNNRKDETPPQPISPSSNYRDSNSQKRGAETPSESDWRDQAISKRSRTDRLEERNNLPAWRYNSRSGNRDSSERRDPRIQPSAPQEDKSSAEQNVFNEVPRAEVQERVRQTPPEPESPQIEAAQQARQSLEAPQAESVHRGQEEVPPVHHPQIQRPVQVIDLAAEAEANARRGYFEFL